MDSKDSTKVMKYLIFLACGMGVIGLGVHFIENSKTPPKKQIGYENVIPIPDLNKDSILELKVQYKNNLEDTLFSRIEDNKIIYQP